MADWPTRVLVDGVDQSLGLVLADVTIRHGRGDVFDPPVASSCQITLLQATRAQTKAFRIGGTLQVLATLAGVANVSRFAGRTTDAALDEDELVIIGIGNVARLSRYTIGTGSWPAESWSARVSRIFSEAGLASYLQLEAGSFNPTLAARAAAAVTLLDYLTTISLDVGAAVVDTPDGKVLVQSTDSRTASSPVVLAPADVAYAPVWQQSPTVCNDVTVEYDGGTVHAADSTSSGAFGPLAETITTDLDFDVDAQTRANQYIARRAFPRWRLPGVETLIAYPVKVGVPVRLSSLPASAPYPSWSPVVEGWSEQINGDDWTQLLALSDPLISGLVLTWAQVPTTSAYHWNTIDPAVAWRDAITLDDLLASFELLEVAA